MKFLFVLLIVSTSLVHASDLEELVWARDLIKEGQQSDAYRPKDGYVPDEHTAIQLAISIWEPIYGKEHIATKKPYNAVLVDGYWVVSGSLPKLVPGGVPHAVIEKITGKIVYVIHGQ